MGIHMLGGMCEFYASEYLPNRWIGSNSYLLRLDHSNAGRQGLLLRQIFLLSSSSFCAPVSIEFFFFLIYTNCLVVMYRPKSIYMTMKQQQREQKPMKAQS